MKALKLSERRRRFYRGIVNIEVAWSPLCSDGPLENLAFARNLSEDGLAMVGNGGEPPGVSEFIVIRLPIPGRFPVFVAGQVLRHLEANEGYVWGVAVQFRGSEERDRDRIFAYLLREQRKQIKSRREEIL